MSGAGRAYHNKMVRSVLALSLCVAALALAEEPQETPQAEDSESPARPDKEKDKDQGLKLNPEGAYGGVTPGTQNLPPRPPKMPLKKGPQRLTWSGFQVKDGVPTVFIEVTGTPDYHVAERPGELVVTLRNTVVPIKNNRRPLRVEAFNTSVKNVETAGKGRDTRVTIRTKDASAPGHKEHVEAAAGGFQMLLIELGK